MQTSLLSIEMQQWKATLRVYLKHFLKKLEWNKTLVQSTVSSTTLIREA